PIAPPAPGGDVYVQDGSETALAIDAANHNRLVAVYNQAWDLDPDEPHRYSADGNASWTAARFPVGAGAFSGSPFDPWIVGGNAPGEFFTLLLRPDLDRVLSHAIIARSTNGGAAFSLFFEEVKAVFQDRAMMDIDRSTALGGGPGTAHDGRLYLCYDAYSGDQFDYAGSFLQVVSPAGSAVREVQISGTAEPTYHGVHFQPELPAGFSPS
ncbi:MAG: hypothetical protein ACREJ4_05440, partial [Candidatus Methylomirabilaceae bacterium]